MKRLCTLFFGLTLLVSTQVLGQGAMDVFHDPGKLGAAFKKTPKLSMGLDSRRSFISNRDVKTYGLRVSMDFENRARCGFGFYFLASPFYRQFPELDPQGQPIYVPHKLQFSYISAYFEYVILSSKRWEFSLPVHLGIGDVGFKGIAAEPKTVLLTEGTLIGSYKIFPFFGLGGGVGYRQILAGGSLIRENFNSPTYSFGLKFWFGYLYQKLIKKKDPDAPSAS